MASYQPNYNIAAMPDEEIRWAFAKCFKTREGQIVLAVLKRMTQERYLGPDSSADALRHLEGQRQLVGYMLSLLG